MSPYLNPGNRIPPLKIIQELRGNVVHRSQTGRIWNRLAQPIDRMLGYSDVSGLWIRCNDANAWAAFWHVAHFHRQLASGEEDWARMLPGQMKRLLPLHLALPGHRQTIPILWTSGDATLGRIGCINWRTREFFVEKPDELPEPFLGIRPKGRISDFEYIVAIGSIHLRGALTPRRLLSTRRIISLH